MDNVLDRPEPRLVEEIELSNGLKAEFYDCSRRVAGDRWYVCLLTRVPIEIKKQDFQDHDNSGDLYREFVEQKGSTVFFEAKKERNFIDEREKDEIFTSLLNRQKAQLNYMGHSAFAQGVVRREIADFKEKRTWWR